MGNLIELIWENKESLSCIIPAALAFPVILSFTLRQRKWIKERDNNQSQMRHYSEEQGWHTSPERPGDTIEVHHIQMQSEGGLDTPENGISLWQREHTGKNARKGEFIVHPEMEQARQDYHRGDKEAFKKAAEKHREQAKHGEPTHNDDHDIEMQQTATERTQNKRDKPWPKHTRRVK
jgi:hypothetical protein